MNDTEKPKPFPNFLGKIERGTIEDFKDVVEVTEKMDGSYFQFGWYNGEFRYRTKGTLDVDGINDKMFMRIIDILVENKDTFRFAEEVVFCCEYFRGSRHNKIKYTFEEDVPHLFIIKTVKRVKEYYSLQSKPGEAVIDIAMMEYNWKENEETKYAFEFNDCPLVISYVPLLDIKDEKGDPFRMTEGRFGAIREGVVIKNSKGERFKFVNDNFKEVTSRRKKRKPIEVDSIFTHYMEGLPNRVDKAIFRLKEQGIEFTKEQFGRIIGDTVKDLLLEERENIKEEVFKFYELSFKKRVNRDVIDIILDRYNFMSKVKEIDEIHLYTSYQSGRIFVFDKDDIKNLSEEEILNRGIIYLGSVKKGLIQEMRLENESGD